MTIMDFSERFSEAREEAVLTLREIANDLGVSFQSVQKWEKGINLPRGKRQKALAQLLGVSAAWLFFESGPKDINTSVIKMLSHINRKNIDLQKTLDSIDVSKKEFNDWRVTNIIPAGKVEAVSKALDVPATWLTEEDHLHDIQVVPARHTINSVAREPSNEEYFTQPWERDAINALRSMDDDRRRRALQNLADGAELTRIKKAGNDG